MAGERYDIATELLEQLRAARAGERRAHPDVPDLVAVVPPEQ
jgi:hypothetical protein